MSGAPDATIGIDLGGTHVRVGVVDADGTLLTDVRGATPQRLDQIVDAITDGVQTVRSKVPDAWGVGIGAAGMVGLDGVVHYAPNITGLVGAPLQRLVADSLGMPVAIDNDANVAALGELTHGIARGSREMLCVTLGTGVGGGIVTDGRVLRGASGFAAEIGHFQVDPDGPLCACGERGHWEAVASGTALGAMGRARATDGLAPSVLAQAGGVVGAIAGRHVGTAAIAGAPDALAIMAEYARNVAIGLVGLANVLDPEMIVISGGLVELGDALLGPLRSEFAGHVEGAHHRPVVPIVPSALGERAGVIGAAVLARSIAGAP